MVKEITSIEQFEKEIASGRTLVDTYAIWCGPCQMLSPIVDEFSEEHPEINVIKVNIDELDSVAIKYSIMAIPTLLYFENGQLVDQSTGFIGKEAIEQFCKIG